MLASGINGTSLSMFKALDSHCCQLSMLTSLDVNSIMLTSGARSTSLASLSSTF
jgi:hypothetical protein